MSEDFTRAEVCCVAVAECFRGDGEILANPIGTIPMIGGRLARATFEPELVMTDGYAMLAADVHAVGTEGDPELEVEGWNPYRTMFDVVWGGKRHVMMGATQVDRYGNQNIAALGDPAQPKVQLLGFRGAPGNTVCNPTSYFVPNHTPKVFVEKVDVVTGVGWDHGCREIRRVISNLGVMDFDTPDHRMRLRSVHPGVTVDEVQEATGFALIVADDIDETRPPTDEDLTLIREVLDPQGLREAEVRS